LKFRGKEKATALIFVSGVGKSELRQWDNLVLPPLVGFVGFAPVMGIA
jgi:hypothetical protein